MKNNTYSLAKSLHHINIAREYMLDVRRDAHSNIKNMFNNYITKCDFILNGVKDMLSEENRIVFKKEMSDSFLIEAINDKLIYLDENEKLEVENFIDLLIKKSKDEKQKKQLGG
jgi:hypothetical protein